MAVLGLRFCARAFSSCGKWGPLFIAVRGPLTIAASLVAEHRLQMCKLSNCGSRTQLLRGMWDLPRPGLEPVSPALAGRFSTTVPPGKPQHFLLLRYNWRNLILVQVYNIMIQYLYTQYRWSQLMMVHLTIFQIMMVWKLYTFNRNYTSDFEYLSFPWLSIDVTVLSCDDGQQQWQQATAPSQTHDLKGKQLIHLQPFFTHTAILFFTLCTVFSKLL